ncbi:hypothetical protein N7509_000780 [Penicillium cosmopolitanum]|uniref:Bromo domain-containing protein n=1 Tax=Penicillium cosmopolitanum TaxID=1131564 RepID=A0A9X0BEJ6_9EURO|nr:uncharacterized protein N7509_000780 [Penicillium cosmopolitanum]KAJ5414153.1 hypothetical protein N7509_000780 [Penicillium cosmopolitanum]
MATPPPEAAPVVKEEKPQLPPSPTGASAPDVAFTSGQNAAIGLKTDSPAPTPTPATENVPATNGHSPSAPPTTNGTSAAASPPNEPPAVSASVIASVTSPATPEINKSEETPAPVESQPPATSVTASTPTDNTPQPQPETKPEPQPSTNSSADIPAAPLAATDNKPAESEDKMAIDSPAEAAAPSTQLPHHPTTTEITTPILPSIQTDHDHEMKDAPVAPMSPSKLSREREADPAEEPAAKRTRVEGQDAASREYRMAVPPTPAAAPPAPASATSGARISKMQQKFIQKSLTTLKRMHDSRFYREAVDWVKLNIPNYPHVITEPMDLSTMEKKLKNNLYSSTQEVFRDFDLMVNNSLVFNGPDHLVYQEGDKLKHTFHKQMTNLPKPDEVEEKKTKKTTEKTSAARREPRTSLGSTTAKAASPQSTTFALGPEGTPHLPYATKPKKKKYQWELRFCQEALEELWKPKYSLNAIPFYAPVDPVALNIPTYHSIIKKPMDMTSIKSKLTTGQYENSKEFEADVRLMFKNCYRFNLPGDPTYQCGKALEAVFDLKWAQKQEYLDRHEPHPEHNSDSSEDDSEEEAESDEDDEQLSELQRKIAEMSRQVEMITQKKKKTPPTSKKSGTKTKAVKKDSKKATTKKEKKSSKPAKPEKARFVSYNEKQIISNGISALPDKKMQQALQIIQSNVPSLKNTAEAEIELDIDELPNDVLLLLLKFVKKNAPNVVDDEEEIPGNPHVSAAKPKKNKPMSKFEQEAQINMLESNLSRFAGGGGGGSPDPMPSVEAMDSSEDESDDDSEESEEE